MGIEFGKLWQRLESLELVGEKAGDTLPQDQDSGRMVVVGMSGAGKSTILHQFKGGRVESVIPSIGVHIEKIEHHSFSIVSWDSQPLDRVSLPCPLCLSSCLARYAMLLVAIALPPLRLHD